MSWKRLPQVLVGLLVLLLLAWLWMNLPVAQWLDQLRAWILALGNVGVIVFVLLYVFVTVVLGPATALTLMAGLAYGVWGFVLVVLSATLAASVAFLIGRYIAHAPVKRWIQGKPKLRALHRAVSDEGWRVVGLVRLSPIIPYGFQNYLFSVTDIKFIPYVLATLIGIMPASALYVYIGSLGQVIGKASTLQWVLVLAGLLATAFVAWLVGKRASAVLQKQSADESQ